MTATINTSISIQKALFDQTEILAQQLNISQSHLFEIAIEDFIKNYQSQALPDELIEDDQGAKTAAPIEEARMVINQGDIFWIRLEKSSESELGHYPHPYVVIQDNILNRSRINSVVVCALTSNIKQANAPGNVLLEVGEANLPKQSVVVVSKVSTVAKTQLDEYIGSVTQQRVNQILAGMRFLQLSFFNR